jgi:hypothetical protein
VFQLIFCLLGVNCDFVKQVYLDKLSIFYVAYCFLSGSPILQSSCLIGSFCHFLQQEGFCKKNDDKNKFTIINIFEIAFWKDGMQSWCRNFR